MCFFWEKNFLEVTMICTNCKKEIDENVKFCPECGVKIELQSEDKDDNETVLETDANQDEVTTEESLETETDILGRPIPKKQKVVEQKDEPKEPSPKSRLGGALLALFFGWSGAHRFYLNNKNLGRLQLFLSFIVFIIIIILGFDSNEIKPYIWFLMFYIFCGVCFFFLDFISILGGKFKDGEGRRVTLWRPKSSCAITMYVLCALIAIACLISFGVYKHKEYEYKHSQEYFHKAIEKGDVNIVKELIEYGINVNQAEKIDKYGSDLSPIYRAVQKENIEIVKLLLNAGANANETVDGYGYNGTYKFNNASLLFIASRKGSASIVKSLIENGANINSKANEYRYEENKSERDSNARKYEIPDENDGEWVFDCIWTPLMIASVNNHIDVVKVLLDNDAELMTRNTYGNTAIDLARINDAPDALSVLLRYRRKIYGY